MVHKYIWSPRLSAHRLTAVLSRKRNDWCLPNTRDYPSAGVKTSLVGQLICITSLTIFQAHSGCQMIKQMFSGFGLKLTVPLLAFIFLGRSQLDFQLKSHNSKGLWKQYVKNHSRAQCSSSPQRVRVSQRRLHQLDAGCEAPGCKDISFLQRSVLFLQLRSSPAHRTVQWDWQEEPTYSHVSQLTWNMLKRLHHRQIALLAPILFLTSPFQPCRHSGE